MRKMHSINIQKRKQSFRLFFDGTEMNMNTLMAYLEILGYAVIHVQTEENEVVLLDGFYIFRRKEKERFKRIMHRAIKAQI